MSYFQNLSALVLNTKGIMDYQALLQMRGVAFKNIIDLRNWDDVASTLRIASDNLTTRTALMEQPGILLLTEQNGEPDAEEVCRRIKAHFPELYTVIVLDQSSAATFEADATVVDALMLWPFTGEELRDKLNQVFEAHAEIKRTENRNPETPETAVAASSGSAIPHIGDKIDKYMILDIIDVWRNSAIYKVIDLASKEVYALKLLTVNQDFARESFFREISIMSEVKHKNLIQFCGSGNLRGRPYLLMEYIDGANLENYLLLKGPPPVNEFLRISIELAEGLQALHTHGFTHRDIKLSNVILSRDSKSVILTDFGIAGVSDPTEEDSSCMLEGTPIYMAPELLKENAKRGIRSDIYSFGAAMYHFLSGRPPFSWTSNLTKEQVLAAHPKSLRLLRPEIPAPLDHFITDVCMANLPEERPASMEDVIRELTSIRDTAQKETASKGKHCVLVVDDDSMMLDLLQVTLRREPYEVITAKSADEALALLRAGQKPVHLLMTDFNLRGGMNGVELSVKVQEQWPEIIRIVFSGQADLDIVVNAVNAGQVYKFLLKNWTNTELKRNVEMALERYEMEHRNHELEQLLTKTNDELYKKNLELEKHVAERTAELKLANEQMNRQYTGLTRIFFKLMQLQYEDMPRHARRVGVFVRKLAEKASVPESLAAEVETAGYLHDIGKMPLSFECNRSLSEDERAIMMKRHPTIGAKLLEDVPGFESIQQMIAQHHEYLDGSGYPDGLRDADVCFGAKVIMVVDSFDRILMPESEPGIKRVLQFAVEQLQKLADSRKIDSGLCHLFLENLAKEFYSFKDSEF